MKKIYLSSKIGISFSPEQVDAVQAIADARYDSNFSFAVRRLLDEAMALPHNARIVAREQAASEQRNRTLTPN